MLATLMPFLGQIMAESAIDLATKELVIMRVSQLNGCRYCLAAHRPVARAAGVSEHDLMAVCDLAPLEGLPERERAVVAWVDQVTIDAGGVDEALLERTFCHLRLHEMAELTVLAGTITMLNQYCTAFSIPPPT